MSEPRISRDSGLFVQLVLGLSQSAMMALGKLMNPITHKVETDLEAARDTIDTLAAVEARTRGNLDPDEARVLQQTISGLRLNYVDVLKQRESAPVASQAGPPAPDAPAPTAPASEAPPPPD